MYLVSRKETFAKLFFLLSFSGLVMYVVLAFYTFHTAYINLYRPERFDQRSRKSLPETSEKQHEENTKYILLWSNPFDKPNYTVLGQDILASNNCSYQNCFITDNKTKLKDVTDYEAIVFNLRSFGLNRWKRFIPVKRSPKQKYIFFSMVPSDLNPICDINADGFFNWTWSYKRYSDIVTPFIEVRDMSNNVVGPRIDDSKEIKVISNESLMNEMDSAFDLTSEDEDDKNSAIRNKTKALAIYFTNCDIPNNVRSYVMKLRGVLLKNDLTFDVYGCGYTPCPKEGCFKAIERDHYFYLVYQNYNSEDYVTDEVLKALHHNAVPIVLGGTDYSRFLPSGSYINAAHESMELLAALISYTITSPGAYQKFFLWKNHFKVQKRTVAQGFCQLCNMLNDVKKMKTHSSYEHFRKWWYYGDLSTKCLPKSGELLAEVLAKSEKKNYIKPNPPSHVQKKVIIEDKSK